MVCVVSASGTAGGVRVEGERLNSVIRLCNRPLLYSACSPFAPPSLTRLSSAFHSASLLASPLLHSASYSPSPLFQLLPPYSLSRFRFLPPTRPSRSFPPGLLYFPSSRSSSASYSLSPLRSCLPFTPASLRSHSHSCLLDRLSALPLPPPYSPLPSFTPPFTRLSALYSTNLPWGGAPPFYPRFFPFSPPGSFHADLLLASLALSLLAFFYSPLSLFPSCLLFTRPLCVALQLLPLTRLSPFTRSSESALSLFSLLLALTRPLSLLSFPFLYRLSRFHRLLTSPLSALSSCSLLGLCSAPVAAASYARLLLPFLSFPTRLSPLSPSSLTRLSPLFLLFLVYPRSLFTPASFTRLSRSSAFRPYRLSPLHSCLLIPPRSFTPPLLTRPLSLFHSPPLTRLSSLLSLRPYSLLPLSLLPLLPLLALSTPALPNSLSPFPCLTALSSTSCLLTRSSLFAPAPTRLSRSFLLLLTPSLALSLLPP
ncbi:hypothetical protein C7M84_009971 [Penaeus vannamei]|uniref:Uncharacterized protein n=1 Tax=Penaeus vannamei TaxID=6689 RepID=A0A3R7M3B0_PENVA|nr:hypothetical protein C7M84_009971 [Penaeus vannamei]